jgi:glycine oxidase
VLLTPVTAEAITQVVTTGVLPEVAEPFVAARFAPGKVAS